MQNNSGPWDIWKCRTWP